MYVNWSGCGKNASCRQTQIASQTSGTCEDGPPGEVDMMPKRKLRRTLARTVHQGRNEHGI